MQKFKLGTSCQSQAWDGKVKISAWDLLSVPSLGQESKNWYLGHRVSPKLGMGKQKLVLGTFCQSQAWDKKAKICAWDLFSVPSL